MAWKENFDWIGKNYGNLVKEYKDKWIAVLDKKVIGVADSLEKLKKMVKNKSKDRLEEIAFEFITDKKFPDFDSG
ncbi:MAG: hypothetical protein J7L43_02145 [Candidatus Aenigmarchaeota archaeon]|nr:hypothetical protein [Candidatus Aenigmarchaeota archaeon]